MTWPDLSFHRYTPGSVGTAFSSCSMRSSLAASASSAEPSPRSRTARLSAGRRRPSRSRRSAASASAGSSASQRSKPPASEASMLPSGTLATTSEKRRSTPPPPSLTKPPPPRMPPPCPSSWIDSPSQALSCRSSIAASIANPRRVALWLLIRQTNVSRETRDRGSLPPFLGPRASPQSRPFAGQAASLLHAQQRGVRRTHASAERSASTPSALYRIAKYTKRIFPA